MTTFKLTPRHFTISVTDLNESINWYSEKLGFRLVKRVKKDSINAEIAFMELNGFFVEMFFIEGSIALSRLQQDPTKSLNYQGLKYFAFGVEDIEDIVAILKERHIYFVTDISVGVSNHRYAIFLDINGILIELYENQELRE